MQIYSDLTITGNENALAELLARFDRSGGSLAWERDMAVEAQLGIPVVGRELRGYKQTNEEAETPAHLWLKVSPRELEVTNIVPDKQSELSKEAYYKLIVSFRNTVLAVAPDLPIKVSDPVLDVAPGELLTESGYKLLRTFSTLANRSTGVAHPRDRERWNAFIIELHRRRVKVAPDDLQRVLIEHENWPEAKAGELAFLFESEQSLLSDLAQTA